MKQLLIGLALFSAFSTFAQVNVSRQELGSGQPGLKGYENAVKWDNNIFHAPQYMPGYPTAAVLWPRVVDVECVKAVTGLNCKGYNWLPELGRGEYLMIRPVVKEDPKPVVLQNTIIERIPVPGPERVIIIEQAPKKKAE